MNKFTKGLLLTALSTSVIAAAGCGNQNSDAKSSLDTKQVATQEQTKETTPKSKYPFPSDVKATGKAAMVLSTDSGTSENGNVPVLFSSEDDILIQIGLDATNFDGSKQSFVFVDKMYSDTQQFGEDTTTTVDLDAEMGNLKPGVHTVSIIQFDNDDPKTGKVTTLTQAKYEIKEKK